MSNRFYLAADGGGSKLQAVLYDENFDVIRTGIMSGSNVMFKPVEETKAEIDRLLDSLLDGVSALTSVDVCLVGSEGYFQESLQRRCRVEGLHTYSEPCMGLAAAFCDSGALALSGTGSDAFLIKDGKVLVYVGGWGPLFGDEGSGYDIGLSSIKAAIYAYDCRRPPTVLTDMIIEKFDLNSLWDIVSRMNRNPNARYEIASVAKLTAKAAEQGDSVAILIYRHAAHEMALQAITAIRRAYADWNGKLVLMGGAWKGSSVMAKAFESEVKQVYPEAKMLLPVYDPVIGCVILRALREGMRMEEIQARLQGKFDMYLYKTGGIS